MKKPISKEEFVKLFMETEFTLDLSQAKRLDIMGKFYSIVFSEYQKLREENANKETLRNVGFESKGFDCVFTSDEVRNILQVYKESFYLHEANALDRAGEIKKAHNKILKSCLMGGVLDEEEDGEML